MVKHQHGTLITKGNHTTGRRNNNNNNNKCNLLLQHANFIKVCQLFVSSNAYLIFII